MDLSIAVGTAAGHIGTECLKTHKDDIQQAVKTAVDQGWERDREAGGYASWGNKTKTA